MDEEMKRVVLPIDLLIMRILTDVQRRDIGIEVGKNLIIDLFKKYSENECEPHEWITKIKVIKN